MDGRAVNEPDAAAVDVDGADDFGVCADDGREVDAPEDEATRAAAAASATFSFDNFELGSGTRIQLVSMTLHW